MQNDVLARIDAIIERLRSVGWKEREALKDELLALAREHKSDTVERHLEQARKGLSLELRWEIDEVLEALQPEPEPEPEEEEAPSEEDAPPDGQLRMSDLKEVYADPRGIALFTDKTGTRWFLQQVDPYTGQPMMAELGPGEVEQVKAKLRGSPYWRIGAGVAP